MDGLDLRLASEQFPVRIHAHTQNVGIKVRLPPWIFRKVCHLGPREQEIGLHLGRHHFPCGTGRAALACDDLDPPLPVHPYSGKVG